MEHTFKSYWFNHRGYDWPVNAKKSGLDLAILRATIDCQLKMLFHHRKIFIYRFDLSCDLPSDSNALISRLLRQVKSLLRRRKYTKRIALCWAREIHNSETHHYHVFMILDGSRVNHPHQLHQWLRHYWEHYGRVSGAGYHNVARGNVEALNESVKHCSYLAKKRGKKGRKQGVRRFSASLTQLY